MQGNSGKQIYKEQQELLEKLTAEKHIKTWKEFQNVEHKVAK